MRFIWSIVALLLLIAAGGAWYLWGTLSPCDALKKDVAVALRPPGDIGAAPLPVERIATIKAAEQRIDLLRARECTAALWRIHVGGVNPARVLAAGAPPQPTTGTGN